MITKGQKVINATKVMSIDMMNSSNRVYGAATLRCAPILYALYARTMIINPNDPKWINRDRLVLSTNHASSILYPMLYMADYKVGVDDLKKYCQFGSITPENLDPRLTPGVDAPTGMPGEGIATAAGMALAGKYLAELLNIKSEIINYNVYVVCGIEDIISGIGQEALSFAGENILNNLYVIVEYNRNDITRKNIYFREDIIKHLKSYGFNVSEVFGGSNYNSVAKSLNRADVSKFPTALLVHTSPGTNLVNERVALQKGGPFKDNDYKGLRGTINSCHIPFETTEEVKNYVPSLIEKRCLEEYNLWKKDYEELKKTASGEIKKTISALEKGQLLIDFDSDKFKVKATYNEDLLKSNLDIMKIIAKKTPLFMGGGSDAEFCMSKIGKNLYYNEYYDSNSIEFKNRYNAYGSILNGMALCNLRPFGSVPLVYSECAKNSMRLSSYMNLPVTYIYTHDTPFSMLDGAIYQPVEQIGSLRNTPGMNVFRPADISELFGTWEYILKHNNKPSTIVLGTEKIKKQEGTVSKYVWYGAYMIKKELGKLDAVIISTGNEISLALQVEKMLQEEDLNIRVVSMPSMNLFLEQKENYQKLLLPKGFPIFVIEASNDPNWLQFVTSKNHIIGINKYGQCGQKEDLIEHYEYSPEDIAKKIKNLL